MSTKIYGSFYVTIPSVDNSINKEEVLPSLDYVTDYKKILVNPLDQNKLAEGWTLVVPKPRYKVNQYTNRYGNKVNKKIFFNNTFKINLAKLPDNLWSKLRPIYEEDIYSYSIAKNNRYNYIVNPTPVDNEIKELRNIVNNYNDNDNDKYDRIIELLQVLYDNSINGWIVIRAKNIIGQNIQSL